MDFKEELSKLVNDGFLPDEEIIAEKNLLEQIKESVIKLNKTQKETLINVEDIQCLLEEAHTGQEDILKTLISVIDYFDDFYIFAEKDKQSNIFKQAEMMLNGIAKKITSIGLTRLEDNYTVYDPDINTVEVTEQNADLPNGYITKTLRCGYVYNGEVIRKSKVVVVKNN